MVAGVGDMVTGQPKVPRRVRRLARRLSRYGGVRITPDAIELDGSDVAWSDVSEMRSRNLAQYLLSDAVRDIAAVRGPPPVVPGSPASDIRIPAEERAEAIKARLAALDAGLRRVGGRR